MLREETSQAGQGFIAGNQFNLSRLYLRYASPYFRKLSTRDLR